MISGKVFTGPYVNSAFQNTTIKAVSDAGIETQLIYAKGLFPLQRASADSECSILHIDWLHPFYKSQSSLKRLVKENIFKADIKLLSKKPLVWNVHNLVSHGADPHAEDRAITPFLERTDVVISFTQIGIDLIKERWPILEDKRFEVIPHGDFTKSYPNEITKEEARHRLGVPDDRRVGLYFGRICEYKGVEDLIPAFNKCSSSEDLLILAGSPETPDIRNRIEAEASSSNRILTVFRHVDDEEVQLFFRASDYGIFPFRSIFNSGSVILALSFGLPVVAPETKVLSEVVTEEAHFSYSAESSTGLLDALKQAMDCSSLRKKGAQGKSALLQRENWHTKVNRLRSLYAELSPNK